MKKIIIFFKITVLCVGIAWGQGQIPDKAYEKISEITATLDHTKIGHYFAYIPGVDSLGQPININYLYAGRRAYFFYGFDFENYEAGHPNLTAINEAQMDAIINGKQGLITSARLNYSIVGHSQGGLTALGYLSALKREHPPQPDEPNLLNNIDAVITISGAIQGAKILDNNLNIKGHEKVRILAGGFEAAFGFFDILPFDSVRNYFAFSSLMSLGLEVFWWFTPLFMQPFYSKVWYDPSLKTLEQLRDMRPGSDYIKNNVVQTVPHRYPVKTGKKILTSEWRYNLTKNKRKIWYLWVGKVDEIVYKTMTEAVPQFDPDVPVGFIVGTENRTLRMGDDNGKKAYDIVKDLETGFAIVESFHIAKCVAIVGFFTGSPLYAENSNRARKLCRNIDAEMAEIIGSSQGDGFIPLANQYIPATFTDPNSKPKETRIHLNNVLSDPDNKGYIGIKDTHKGMESNTEAFRHAARMTIEGFRKRRDNGLRNQGDIP